MSPDADQPDSEQDRETRIGFDGREEMREALREDGPDEPGSDRSSVTYGYLSLMRASMDCPEWDDEEGDESLFAGKHPEAWMPRVYSEERDAVVGRRYERVALVELPERMKSDDAFDWARENQPGPLDEWYEDDEPEIATDGGTEQTGKERGPMAYECAICGADTYETGPCHECGALPHDDGLRADGGETQETDTEQTQVGHVIEDGDAIDVYAARGNGRKSMGEVPIGTRGWLGNPYPEARHGRETCIEKFREDFEERLQTDEEFREAVRDLAGQTLGCFCQTFDEDGPACHAEVIADHADRLASIRADGSGEAGTDRGHTIDDDGFLRCHVTGERRQSWDLDGGDCPECGEEIKGFLTDGGEPQETGTERSRWVCLDLFSGLGGFSHAFELSENWEVVTVDLEERFDPDIQADVLDLEPADLPDPDLIFAGHPCTVFSKAAAWQEHWGEDGNPQTEKARRHVAMVFHTLGLIRALAPRYWFLENPEGHMRRFLGEPTGSVTYCQYGEDYRKPTDLWGEHPPMTYRRCSNGDRCHTSRKRREKAGDEHVADAMPRDPAKRAEVPEELSFEILRAVEDAIRNPPPEQAELPGVIDA